MAAAHALYEKKKVPPNALINFETLYSGCLAAQAMADGTIQLSFPSTPPELAIMSLLELQHLAEGFGFILLSSSGLLLSSEEIKSNGVLYIGRSLYDIMIEVTPSLFHNLMTTSLNFGAIAKLGGRGVLITCIGGAHFKNEESSVDCSPPSGGSILSNPAYDFVSRCFFPVYVSTFVIYIESILRAHVNLS